MEGHGILIELSLPWYVEDGNDEFSDLTQQQRLGRATRLMGSSTSSDHSQPPTSINSKGKLPASPESFLTRQILGIASC